LYVETPAKESGMFGKKQLGFETGLEQIKESVAKPQKNKKNQSVENNSIEPHLGTYFVRTSIEAADEALLG
jgi:hypothetical protein